jgi:hypothetical protein
LPPLDGDLPKEYQEASEAATVEPNKADGNDEEEEVKSGSNGEEVDATLPGKTPGQRRQAQEKASQVASTDSGKDEAGSGHPSGKA